MSLIGDITTSDRRTLIIRVAIRVNIGIFKIIIGVFVLKNLLLGILKAYSILEE